MTSVTSGSVRTPKSLNPRTAEEHHPTLVDLVHKVDRDSSAPRVRVQAWRILACSSLIVLVPRSGVAGSSSTPGSGDLVARPRQSKRL